MWRDAGRARTVQCAVCMASERSTLESRPGVSWERSAGMGLMANSVVEHITSINISRLLSVLSGLCNTFSILDILLGTHGSK